MISLEALECYVGKQGIKDLYGNTVKIKNGHIVPIPPPPPPPPSFTFAPTTTDHVWASPDQKDY